jgi:enolase
MALERLGYGLLPEEEETGQFKILNELLNEKNIDMITEILSPIDFALFDSLIEQLEETAFTATEEKLTATSTFLKMFSLKIKKFMVSYKRQSRSETYNTLADARREKSSRSWQQKLLGIKNEKEG